MKSENKNTDREFHAVDFMRQVRGVIQKILAGQKLIFGGFKNSNEWKTLSTSSKKSTGNNLFGLTTVDQM